MIAVWLMPLARGDDWITIVIFVIIAFGSLITQGLKKMKESGNPPPSQPRRAAPPVQRPSPSPQQPSGQWTTQEDDVRKFLEALGKPRTVPPPPPIRAPVPLPRPVIRRPAMVQRPPTPVVRVPAPRDEDEEGPQTSIPEEAIASFKPMVQVDVAREMKEVEAQVDQAAKTAFSQTQEIVSTRATEFAKLLKQQTNVRRAIVMAEIVGPPLALRGPDPAIQGW